MVQTSLIQLFLNKGEIKCDTARRLVYIYLTEIHVWPEVSLVCGDIWVGICIFAELTSKL